LRSLVKTITCRLGCAGGRQSGCAGPGPSGRLMAGLARHRPAWRGRCRWDSGQDGTRRRPRWPPRWGPLRAGGAGRVATSDNSVRALVCSVISVFRRWMRWARARRLVAVLQSRHPRWPAGGAVTGAHLARCGQAPSRSRRCRGRPTTSAWSWRWASVAVWTAERRAASRTDNAARRPAARGWASWSRARAS
jgi:hypothetical protein